MCFGIHNEGKLKITRCETGNLENMHEMSQSPGCSTIRQCRSPELILSLLFEKKIYSQQGGFELKT